MEGRSLGETFPFPTTEPCPGPGRCCTQADTCLYPHSTTVPLTFAGPPESLSQASFNIFLLWELKEPLRLGQTGPFLSVQG